jgi:CrcB protein
MMIDVLLLCLGGVLGTLSRYGVQLFSIKFLSPIFPYGTIIVNSLGCFVVGFLFVTVGTQTQWIRLLFFIGFCGAFTTLSSFVLDSYLLYNLHSIDMVAINFFTTFIASYGLFFLGLWVGRVCCF